MVGLMPIPNPASTSGLVIGAVVSLFFAVLLSAAAVSTATAQSVSPAEVNVSFASDRSELTVGDSTTLSLKVSHAAELVVVLPRLEREWGPFEVQDQTSARIVSTGSGMKTIAREYRVALFSPGVFDTPSLPVSVRSPDGMVEQVVVDPVRVTVNSVLSGHDETLKDIRPPADLSTSFWERPGVLVPVALAMLAALGVPGHYLYRRSRREAGVTAPETEALNPWEAAIRELDLISRLDLPGSGDMKRHYTLVVDALRTYLGATRPRGTGLADGADMSTEEAVAVVRQSALDHGEARLIIELLHEADLVKFADLVPPASRAYEVEGRVRGLVETERLSLEGRVLAEASAPRGEAP